MLQSIRRKINKTPIENSSTIVKSVNELNEELLLELLASQHAGEGVFGIEQFSTKESNEIYYFTPALQRINIGEESSQIWNWSDDNFHKHLSCFELELTQPTFLPIYTQANISLLEDLSLLTNNDVDIYVQILFSKRIDEWWNSAIYQYEDFLSGNDHPSKKKMTRLVQMGAIKIFEKLEGSKFKRERIQQIESKIQDEGFRTEIRLIIMSDKKNKLEQTEEELRVLLRDYDYFNELSLTEIIKSGKKEFLKDIEKRKFSTDSQDQIFSFTELQSIILSDSIVTAIQPNIPQQTQSINTGTNSTPVSSNIPLHLLPIGEKKERPIDYSIADKLGDGLNRTKITKSSNIEITKVEQGATLQKITIKIPEGINFTDIKKKYEDLQVALGTNSFSVVQGDEAGTVSFIVPLNEREVVYLKSLLEDERFVEFAKKNPLPFIVGLDISGKPIYECLSRTRHLLFCGQTGGGKSVWLNAVLITFMFFRNPDELNLYLIDPKKVELQPYNGYPHVKNVITDMSEAFQLFESLIDEMDKRYEFLAKEGYKDISSYNKYNPDNKKPFIVVVIDEFKSLKTQYPDVEIMIERMGGEARAAGIHLLIGTQYPIRESISSIIKENLPSAISFKLKSNRSYQAVFGTGIPYSNLLGKGDGVAKLEGHKEEFIRFQGAVITTNQKEEGEVLENIKNELRHTPTKTQIIQPEIETVIQEEPIDQLKRIVANEGEVRTAELQKKMGIRINKVSELRMQLVEEGWLEKEGNKFKIVASEEELSKWKDN